MRCTRVEPVLRPHNGEARGDVDLFDDPHHVRDRRANDAAPAEVRFLREVVFVTEVRLLVSAVVGLVRAALELQSDLRRG